MKMGAFFYASILPAKQAAFAARKVAQKITCAQRGTDL